MKNINSKVFLYLLLILSFYACQSLEDTKLEMTLMQAQNNRIELEKVLQHFSAHKSDKLKLKAARFLIANMNGHASYQGKLLDYYRLLICNTPKPISKITFSSLWKQAKDSITSPVRLVEDAKIIKSDYLIWHINEAFNSWKNAPWNSEVTFTDFCNYILPYRIENESLNKCWIDSIRKHYLPIIEGVTDVNQAYAIIMQSVSEDFRSTKINCPYTLDILTLSIQKAGTCLDECILKGAILRALGIPVSYDYVTRWSNYSHLGHSWISLIRYGKAYTLQPEDSLARCSTILPESVMKLEEAVEEDYKYRIDTLKKANKVYRTHFNSDISEDISQYYGMNTEIAMKITGNNDTVFLCSFATGNDWIPICEAKPKNGWCKFKNIGIHNVYLLMQHGNTDMKPVSAPFILDEKGKIQMLVPDTNRIEKITLERKYPLFAKWYNQWTKMIGGYIEVSTQSDFANAIILDTISSTPYFANRIKCNVKGKYRYVRYVSSNKCRTPMAEIMIYDKRGRRLKGKPIGSSFLAKKSLNSIADGDLMSISSTKKTGYWIGLDLLSSQHIDHIVYYPKNDGNFIEIGETYNLFYYFQGWNSLGTQKATAHQLVFEAPANSLLYLQNKNKGKEERIFIYEKGTQIWY